jgi:quinol monooxygenase YgiN
MATQDLDAAKAMHDAIAGEAMGPATAAGDFGHDALLGTTLLGTTENEFLALDRWTNLDGANAVYSDPAFLRAFGSFFAQPPALDLFERQTTWAEYGEFDIADDDPEHFFVVVRGRVAAGRDAHVLHDTIVGGSSRAAMMAGDLAHLVYLGVDDPQEFFAIDIWGDGAGLEAFYGDPAFQEAVGMLFEAPPSVTVYRSTDWLQW